MAPALTLAALSWLPAADVPATSALAGLRFEVSVPRSLPIAPRDGRLLVVVGRRDSPEPRTMLADAEFFTAFSPPVLGRDATAFGPGSSEVVDGSAAVFPIARVLPGSRRGEYVVQAVFHANRDLNRPDAPGNLYSPPVLAALDPARGGTFRLELTNVIPDDMPTDTDRVKYVKLRSDLLSKFHGRPMYLRAAVILPRDFDKESNRRYPLRVHIGGYGTRYTEAAGLMAPQSRFRRIWLDAGGSVANAVHLRRRRPLRRSVPGQFGQQRPLR